MSLVEQLHAAHKERMARLSPAPRDDAAITALNAEIRRLNEELRKQRFLVANQKKQIEKLAVAAADKNPKLEEVLSCVCKYYDILVEEMRSQSRAGTIPFHRQIYYFLCREYGHSLTQIGLYIRKDHTSVLHGERKIREMAKTDIQLGVDLNELRHKIAAKVYKRQQALEQFMGSDAE